MAGFDDEGAAFAQHLGLPTAHHHGGGRAIGVDFDAIATGPANDEGQVGCVDLDGMVAIKLAHTQVQDALR